MERERKGEKKGGEEVFHEEWATTECNYCIIIQIKQNIKTKEKEKKKKKEKRKKKKKKNK